LSAPRPSGVLVSDLGATPLMSANLEVRRAAQGELPRERHRLAVSATSGRETRQPLIPSATR
jgi:hypothetical protein